MADGLAEQWRREVWLTGTKATGALPPGTVDPEPISLADLQQAAKSFPRGTAAGCDGFQPHWYGWLSDSCLQAHDRIFLAMEIQGKIPSGLYTTIVFIP